MTVCFFVLCKRHWINRVPGAHRGDSLCIPSVTVSDSEKASGSLASLSFKLTQPGSDSDSEAAAAASGLDSDPGRLSLWSFKVA